MKFDKLLIISDKKILKNSYEALLQNYAEIVFLYIECDDYDFSSIQLQLFDGVIVDMEDIDILQALFAYLYSHKKPKQLLVAIAPFDISQMQKICSLEEINFFIQKPFYAQKLLEYLRKQLQKKYELSLVTNKADILIDIIDHYPFDIAIYDTKGVLFYANESYQKNFSIDITHKNTLFDDLFKGERFEYIKSRLYLNTSYVSEYESKQKRWYESLFFFSNDNYLIHSVTDITHRKQKEFHLEVRNLFFENTSDGVMITDSQGIIESINKAFTKITGFDKKEVLGKKPNILKSNIHDKKYYEDLWRDILTTGYFKKEIWNKRKNGQVYPQLLSISKVYNTFTRSYYFIAFFSDLSNLQEADQKIYYYANYDSLTKLPNRSYFYKQFHTFIQKAKEKTTKLALLFIDLDKFKEVNDTYGHSVGDKMLQIVSKRLENSIRKDDFLARLGGDEFVIILHDMYEQRALSFFASKLQKRVSHILEIDGHLFEMSLSIGIALFPDHGVDEKKLLQNADIAMYEVKNTGRAGVAMFDNTMFEKIALQTSLKQELTTALQKEEICFFYQPIVDFKTRAVVGVEALVRWNHPTKGYLSPDKFLSTLLEKGLQEKFAHYLYEKIFAQIAYMNKALGSDTLFCAINVTKEQFYDELFCMYLAKKLKQHGIKGEQIEIEIVEDQLLHNKQKAQKIIENLKHMSIEVALDDFGTGYSNIAYLRDFSVSKLKIDQVFIENIPHSKKDQLLTQSIIYYAKIFNMTVQAEGISTHKHYETVQKYSCDFSQGYYHSKPLELEALIQYVKTYKKTL